jgi:hypothetical protein
MKIRHIECECGHIGTASYREKDNAYSSYGIWEFNGFICTSNHVEKKFQMSFREAVLEAEPVGQKCGRAIQ